jgi:membrane-associated phospholipid phosphatase
MRAAALTSALIAALLWTGAGQAQSATAPQPPGESSAAEAPASKPGDDAREQDDHRLKWTYPHFRWWEYAGNVAISAYNLYDTYGTESTQADKWRGGILFDDAARDALRQDSEAGRHRADKISDYLWQPVQFYPILVDSLLVPLAFDDFNVEVAWQMSMINWQVIGLASATLRVIRRPVGRVRPLVGPGETSGPSFPSGHALMVSAGAGAACAHHFALPLYGGGWPDIAACAGLGTLAVANGVTRVMADEHWSTDVLTGWILGGAIGFGLPWLLHYQFDDSGGDMASKPIWKRAAIVPMVGDDRLGLILAMRL